MSEESRKRVLQLAGELVRATPGFDEDVLIIRLHRALRLYTYQRSAVADNAELLRMGLFVKNFIDPLEPELRDFPSAFLKQRAEGALAELNRGSRKKTQ
jgi:hypothetical protein